MDKTKNIKRGKGIQLLSLIAESGKKIFSLSEARDFASLIGVAEGQISNILSLLKKRGWIISLKSGHFALSKGFSTEPLHEFEIAMALTKSVAISHWSALNYLGLSDQIPQKVFLLIPEGVSIPRQKNSPFGTYSVNQIQFVFSRIKKELFFGISTFWLNRTQVAITDPERTLLDGLDKPHLCGGFDEVLHAFQLFQERIDLDKIISYALQWDISIVKRLGWVLSHIGIEEKKLAKLRNVKAKGFRKLDCTGLVKGPYNHTWMIQENIYE